jgi:hypothetical protein
MQNILEPIAGLDLRSVTGGHMHSSPLAALSFFISRSSDSTREVAKSFDVLTLSSPKVCAMSDRIPTLPTLPAALASRKRSRHVSTTASTTVESSMINIDSIGSRIARKRRQRA